MATRRIRVVFTLTKGLSKSIVTFDCVNMYNYDLIRAVINRDIKTEFKDLSIADAVVDQIISVEQITPQTAVANDMYSMIRFV